MIPLLRHLHMNEYTWDTYPPVFPPKFIDGERELFERKCLTSGPHAVHSPFAALGVPMRADDTRIRIFPL